MAHRFNNFDDAFAEWSGRYAILKARYTTTNQLLGSAMDGVEDPVDRYHFGLMHSAMGSMLTLFTILTDHTWSVVEHSSLYESMYWAGQPEAAGEEYELTLIKIIEAYIAAPDDARSAQRLLFDAYKSSMYDKPFDKEYHALWIQRFMSWT